MIKQAALPLCAFLFLAGCYSQPYSLPKSEKLSPEKVYTISETIERLHPNLPTKVRGTLLNTVVKSLDNMVFIQEGEFQMGDFGWPYNDDPKNLCAWPCGDDQDRMGRRSFRSDDYYVHTVKLSNYHLSKFQVSLAEFDLFFVAHKQPVFDHEDRKRKRLQYLYEPNLPAPVKNWQEAKDYCGWLGRLSGYPVDLPTEAQWEFAARNRGQHVAFPTDNGSLDYGRNFPHPDELNTFPVDRFTPNPLGIYNLSGNATDWVNDWFDEDYYYNSPVQDPQGPPTGTLRIKRGANYAEDPLMSASTVRRWGDNPNKTGYFPGTGFRCAVQLNRPL